MPHKPRFVPATRTLVEVSTRTFQGRYFLRPCAEVREVVLGVVGRAQRMYGMEICLLVFMSNHYHMLLIPQDAKQLARFMGFVNGEIAREINRWTGWGAKFWARPFDAILVSDEPTAQLARFRYLVSHGVKEGLVARPEEWIGVHGIDAWLRGKELAGYWFDRSRENRAAKRTKHPDRLAFATRETVVLTPLPCWQQSGTTLEEIRKQIRSLIDEVIERRASLERLEKNLARGRNTPPSPESVDTLVGLPWTFRPDHLARSPRPPFHYRSKTALARWRAAYGEFLATYRRASGVLRSREQDPTRAMGLFPDLCFPPAGPFVRRAAVVKPT